MSVGLIFKVTLWRALLEQLPFITTMAQTTYDRISGRRMALAAAAHADLAARVEPMEIQLREMQADAGGQAAVVKKLAEEVAAQASALEILGARQCFLFGVAGGALVLPLTLLLVVALR